MFIIFYFIKKKKIWGVAHRVAHRVAHKVAHRVAHGLAHGPGPRFCPHPLFDGYHKGIWNMSQLLSEWGLSDKIHTLVRKRKNIAQCFPNVFPIFKNVLRFCTDLYASDVFVLRQKTGQSLDICEWTIWLHFSFCAITLCSKTTQL